MTMIINQDTKFLVYRELVYERLSVAIHGYPYLPSYTEGTIGDWSDEILGLWRKGKSVVETADTVRKLIQSKVM